MNKMMTLVAAIMIYGSVKAEIKNVEAFSEVKVSVPARVRVIKSDEYGISLSSEDTLLTSSIRYNVENGMLSISAVGESASLSEDGGLLITITTPERPSLKAGRDFELGGRKL